MASLIRDKNGSKRIQFMFAKDDRRTIRLGKINVKSAERFYARVENLIDSVQTATPIDSQTAQWLAELPGESYDKLVQVDLAKPRAAAIRHTLDNLLDESFATMNVKKSTRTRYAQARRLLIEHFGKDCPLDSISPHDADKYRVWLEDKEYANAKVSKEIQIARMFFKQAIRWEMIPKNPFEGVRAGAQTNQDRKYYLTPEDTHKLIEMAPDAEWRCIIALARFGGLRCPSEVLGVQWGDIDWDQGRMLVRSPKTERHIGKAERIIPLFPELRSVLMQAFELAPEGSVYVTGRFGGTHANLGTQFKRIITRAGFVPWPRVFNAMRASRATELAAEYPAAICTAWMGHTQAIAEAHYHMVRNEDFEKATSTLTIGPDAKRGQRSGAECGALGSQISAQQQSASTSKEHQNGAQNEKGSALMPILTGTCDSLRNAFNGPGQT
jgi:integrase